MNASLKQRVRRRAGGFCEYCRVHQAFDFIPHHIDHIIARKHMGTDEEDDLCLACANCSLGKGSNISGKDPRTGRITRLFQPRTDEWAKHFRWNDATLVGRTAVGRTTVVVLNINRPDRIALRQVLIDQGKFPRTET